jgi:hypothetical protein
MSTPKQTETHAEDVVRQEIIKLEQRRCDAYLRRDLEALDGLLPEHFTYTRPSGIVLDKRQLLAALDSGEMIFESFDRHCDDVSVYLNTAVAIGRDTVRGRYQGRDISGHYRFSHMYVERDGRWEVVATHASRLAPES